MLTNQLFLLFLIMAAGYAIGRVKVKGISLGAAGILLVALVFGHFGYEVPSIVQNIGLACFVTAVGFAAGPTFFRNFRGKARAYVVIGASIILSGFAVCLAVIWLTGTSVDLSLGLLAGALTTTPGLAAGIEATGSDLVSVGYGIAYPFGVISVVLFVQAVPKLLHYKAEAAGGRDAEMEKAQQAAPKTSVKFDSYGLFSFAVAIVAGYLIGQIKVPLPGGGAFSLGTSGGPLLAGIILGHFRHIGFFDMRIKDQTLVTMRELGLAFFLAGAGSHAGKGFVEILAQRGPILFVYGAVMAVIPLLAGFLTARKAFRLNVPDSLGSICGGMTSTPALGTLITSLGTEEVTGAYAATYPVALALIVVLTELVGGLFR